MSFRFLLLCLLCVRVGLAAPLRDGETLRLKRQLREVLIDFVVRRPGPLDLDTFGVAKDPFCEDGLDAPGNITIHTFYRHRLSDDLLGNWTFLQRNSAQIEYDSRMNVSLAVPLVGEAVQLAVLQIDHAGSHCQPWTINGDLVVKLPDVENILSPTVPQASCTNSEIEDPHTGTSFIEESGSSLRGFITDWFTRNGMSDCSNRGESLEKAFFLPDISPLNCTSDSGPYLDLSFLIHWAYDGERCNTINSFDEGIELSFRGQDDQLWTPLAFFTRVTNRQGDYNIKLNYESSEDSVTIRGFTVPVTLNNTDLQHYVRFRICSDVVLGGRGVQFRWLQTAQHYNTGARDTWSLDDVRVSVYHDSECPEMVVFSDDFENEEGNTLSPINWPASRRASIGKDSIICNDGRNGSAAWFGAYPLVSPQSRMMATRVISLTRDSICPQMALDEDLLAIFNLLYSDVGAGMNVLVENLEGKPAEAVNETQVVFLTSVILDIFGDDVITKNESQSYVNIAARLMSAVNSRTDGKSPPSTSDGSKLLENLDQFALNNHQPSSGDITSDGLSLIVSSGEGSRGDVTAINSGLFSLTLPSQVFNTHNTTFASSFLFQNMSGFLDNVLPSNKDSGSVLMGPVLSSFVYSGRERLERTSLSSPVKITFPYEGSSPDVPICVFWNLTITGWDTRGCVTERNAEAITCVCDHLTHFAVLLSPGDSTSDEGVRLSLQVIGIVGVTVSVIFLLITIFTFIAFRSLWSLRNYIHIQLCVSLVIAQLVFIIGVEPRGNEDACSAVAVLLHYFWLVCFMWMLMEGAVLYIALVKVFDVHHLKYVVAFTIISYGVPLVYMLLCIPLGLALTGSDGNDHYGYREACWLRYDTHFIWAFTAPVILIILINVGFFVMAMVIMCRHHRSQAHLSRRQQTLHWMKASVSLVIVMGITWLMGVLVFTDGLLPLAYIFTIFVAFQGLIIFVVLVIFSKQVRQAYGKWWRVSVVNSEFVSKHFSNWTWMSKSSVSNVQSNGIVSPTMSKERSDTELSHSSGSFLLHPSKASVSSAPFSSITPLAEETSITEPQPAENGGTPAN